MNEILEPLRTPVAVAFGWTLLHFVWQGALLTAVLAMVRAALRDSSAQARYGCGCVALALMFAVPAATFSLLYSPASGTAFAQVASVVQPFAGVGLPTGPLTSASGEGWEGLMAAMGALIPWIVLGWGAGVLLFSMRLARGFWQISQWRGTGEPLPAEVLEDRVRVLAGKMGLSRVVPVVRSCLVRVPMVVGWFRPVILLPVSSLTGLTTQQLDLVLAHELAHIHRGDAWVNLAQSVAETLFFYHPAVWWVSSWIREDREQCCDEVALATCGNAALYAEALARLEEMRIPGAKLSLAASDGSLLGRVRWILGMGWDPAAKRRVVGNALLVLGVMGLTAVGLAWSYAPSLYSATVRFIYHPTGLDAKDAAAGTGNGASPYQLQTEMEQMTGRSHLERVSARLKLAKGWSQRLGVTITDRQAAAKLRQNVRVRTVRNTDLRELTYRSEDAEEATRIANGILESRIEAWNSRQDAGRSKIMDQVITAENQVNRQQERYQTLVAKCQLPAEVTTAEELTRFEQEQTKALREEMSRSEIELLTQKSRIDSLRKLNGPDRLQALQSALPGEVQLPQLLLERARQEQNLASLSKTYGPGHAQIVAQQAAIEKMEEQVKARVDGMLLGMEISYNALQERNQTLKLRLEVQQTEALKRQHESAGLFRARKELDGAQRIRDAILLRKLQEEVDSTLAAHSPIEIVDRGEISNRPSKQANPALVLAGLLGVVILPVGLTLRISGQGRTNE